MFNWQTGNGIAIKQFSSKASLSFGRGIAGREMNKNELSLTTTVRVGRVYLSLQNVRGGRVVQWILPYIIEGL